jgi:predicted transcriptional regulator
MPGYADGLRSLGKGIVPMGEGIYEQDESTYSLREQIEEDQLFTISKSVRTLLQDLESKDLITEQKDEDKT